MISRQRLLGIGECMVELSGDGAPNFQKAFAGDVLNTLWYARTSLGPSADCAFFSAVGDDMQVAIFRSTRPDRQWNRRAVLLEGRQRYILFVTKIGHHLLPSIWFRTIRRIA